MYKGDIKLKVVKVKKGYAIVSGYNILRKFRTQQEAEKELEKNDTFYQYWAKSASSSVVNCCHSGQVVTRKIG